MKGPVAKEVETVPEGKCVTIRGMRLHYLDWDYGPQQTMVLLHGIGDNAHVWDAFSSAASPCFRVIALDQRGHGLSSYAVPPAYRCDDYIADLAGVLEYLEIDRTVMMGHSMGALHATAFAAKEPERISALIHVDIEPCPPGWNKKYLLNLYRDLPDYFTSVEAFVAHQCQNSPYARAENLTPYAAFALSLDSSGGYRQMFDREVLRHFDAYDLRSSLHDIHCPTLVVRGQDSPVMSREVAREMSLAVAKGNLAEIPESAHPVLTDNPGAFREAVFHFLRNQGLLDRH